MIRKMKNLAHLILGIVANIIYLFPARKITVVGVTGTDGKTTTSSLIYYILKTSGHKTALITTVGAYINDSLIPTGLHVTTPTSFALQKFLKQAVSMGHEFAVIETSSHGIDQNRIWGIKYKVAALTNITHEHLDYHKTFDNYLKTKVKFLNSAEIAVINKDDISYKSVAELLNKKYLAYSVADQTADFTPTKFQFQSALFGKFNISNSLAAIAVTKQLGLSDEQIRKGLTSFQAPPGRQEIVYQKEYKVMVDFAHTPNAIESVLSAVREVNPRRIIHVFGAPGRRYEEKRPMMGDASSKYSDISIVTADDPRDELVSDINQKILSGFSTKYVKVNPEQLLSDSSGKKVVSVEDRLEALKLAIKLAQPGDFIVLTGKGHEASLALADKELPWNEKEIVLNIINSK